MWSIPIDKFEHTLIEVLGLFVCGMAKTGVYIQPAILPCQALGFDAAEERLRFRRWEPITSPPSKVYFSLKLQSIIFLFKSEQHRIYAEIHKGDDGIPRTPNQQRGSVSAVQKFIGEGQLEQLAQREIDRHTA